MYRHILTVIESAKARANNKPSNVVSICTATHVVCGEALLCAAASARQLPVMKSVLHWRNGRLMKSAERPVLRAARSATPADQLRPMQLPFLREADRVFAVPDFSTKNLF